MDDAGSYRQEKWCVLAVVVTYPWHDEIGHLAFYRIDRGVHPGSSSHANVALGELPLKVNAGVGKADILRGGPVHTYYRLTLLEGYCPRAKELPRDACSAREFFQAIQPALASQLGSLT